MKPRKRTADRARNRRMKPKEIGGRTFVPILTGTDAKTFTGGTGVRQMGPIEVTVQMKMSPLSISNEEMKICLYVSDPGKGAYEAVEFLKKWYKESMSLASPGYPKPDGDTSVELLEKDSDFDAKYRDAQKEASAQGAELKVKGPREDPTVFHVMQKERRIIVPSSRGIISPGE